MSEWLWRTCRTRPSWHHLLCLDPPAARLAIRHGDRVAGLDLYGTIACGVIVDGLDLRSSVTRRFRAVEIQGSGWPRCATEAGARVSFTDAYRRLPVPGAPPWISRYHGR